MAKNTFTREEMTREDIIDMDYIKHLLATPLSTIKNEPRVAAREITSPSEFNKIMYLVFEGQLRQFKIKRGIKFPLDWKRNLNGREVRNILIIDVAGIGELAVCADRSGYNFHFDIYDSVEEFKIGNARNLRKLYLGVRENISLESIYSNVGTFENFVLYRYKWNGTNAVRYPLNENVCLFLVYDANHVSNLMDLVSYEGYATKEECEKDNAIQVAVFAEEDEEKEDEVQNVVVRCNIEINGVIYDVVDDETLAKIRKLLNY